MESSDVSDSFYRLATPCRVLLLSLDVAGRSPRESLSRILAAASGRSSHWNRSETRCCGPVFHVRLSRLDRSRRCSLACSATPTMVAARGLHECPVAWSHDAGPAGSQRGRRPQHESSSYTEPREQKESADKNNGDTTSAHICIRFNCIRNLPVHSTMFQSILLESSRNIYTVPMLLKNLPECSGSFWKDLDILGNVRNVLIPYMVVPSNYTSCHAYSTT